MAKIMSNLSLVGRAGVGVGECLTESGDSPRTDQRSFGRTFPVRAWSYPTAIAAAACVQRLTRQALRKIGGRFHSKSAGTPGSARIVDSKARERTGRFAVAMSRCTCALEPGRFVLSCSVAASLATSRPQRTEGTQVYQRVQPRLVTRTHGPTHPDWASPIVFGRAMGL